jgi:hypothetical protein
MHIKANFYLLLYSYYSRLHQGGAGLGSMTWFSGNSTVPSFLLASSTIQYHLANRAALTEQDFLMRFGPPNLASLFC